MKNIEEDKFKVTVDRNLESFILTKYRDATQIWFSMEHFAAIYESKYPWEKPILQVVNYVDIQIPKLLETNTLGTIESDIKLPQLTISDYLRYGLLPSKYMDIIQLHFYYQQPTMYLTVYYLKDNIEYNDTLECMNFNNFN